MRLEIGLEVVGVGLGVNSRLLMVKVMLLVTLLWNSPYPSHPA